MKTALAAWCGSIKDVSKLLGIRQHRIDHAIASGLVKEPAIRVANRRVFQKEDLENLRKHFSLKPDDGQAVAAEVAE